MPISAEVVDSLRAKFDTILPHLDERATRLLLGAEARSLGHGGIAAVARASGAARSRVQQGVNELDAGTAPLPGVRKPGAGRKTLTEKDPGLVLALLALVEPTRRGDPESPLSWTTLSTAKLAAELTGQGHRVGAESVAILLKANGFSLQANTKTLEGNQHPDRNAQFGYINAQATDHLDTGQPVISIDAKKKELVGAYKNKGAEWRPAGNPNKSRSTTSSTRN